MRRQILLSLFFLYSFLQIAAQTWGGTTPGNIHYNQGKVGINTTSPIYDFDVNGILRTKRIQGHGYGNLEISSHDNGDGTGYGIDIFAVQNGINFLTYNNNSGWNSRMYINSSGKIGINTASPIYDLDVNGITRTSRIQGQGNRNLEISSHDNGDGTGYGIDVFAVQNGINFLTYNSSGWSSRMYINDGGKIGINTTSPIYDLDVNGVMRTSRIQGQGNSNLEISSHDNGDGSGFGIDLLAVQNGINFKTHDGSYWRSRLFIKDDGRIGIGTSAPEYALDVNGTIRSKEIKVDLNGADFVFEENYIPMSLTELERFIKEKKHLPGIASSSEMEEYGVDLGIFNSKLLQKIEELSLYTIEQNKKIEQQCIQIQQQNDKIHVLEEKIEKIMSLTTQNLGQ